MDGELTTKSQQKVRRITDYVRDNLDEAAIISALVAIALKGGEDLSSEEYVVLAALRRSAGKFQDASIEEISSMLSEYDESQIPGLVNNVKGILFELEFIEIENNDGDSIFAYQFENTNHPAYDIQLLNEETGEISELQLKATDSTAYVQEWIDEHGGNIVVTEEVAERMGLPGIGIENQELEVRVEDFIDKLKDLQENEDAFTPILGKIGTISLAISLVALVAQYQSKRISRSEFGRLSAMMIGKKVVKFSVLAVALSIPGINFVTTVALAANLVIQGKKTLDHF